MPKVISTYDELVDHHLQQQKKEEAKNRYMTIAVIIAFIIFSIIWIAFYILDKTHYRASGLWGIGAVVIALAVIAADGYYENIYIPDKKKKRDK